MTYYEGTGELMDKLSIATLKIMRLEKEPEVNQEKIRMTKNRILDLQEILNLRLTPSGRLGSELISEFLQLHTMNQNIFAIEDALQEESRKENPDFQTIATLHKTRLEWVNYRRNEINMFNREIDGTQNDDVRIHKPEGVGDG